MFSYTPVQKKALRLLGSDARHIMLFGGSRSGKSFALCCSLAARALRFPGSRHAVIRKYCASTRTTIGMDTMPKVLRNRYGDHIRWHFNRAENFFRFSNSSEIWLVGLDDGERADKILGKEFATIYFNECSELDYRSVQTALTRLAQNIPSLINRAYYDCNPPGKNHWCYKLFVLKRDPVTGKDLPDPADYAAMQMNPGDNRCNLPTGYIEKTLANLPLKERLRFLHGQWQEEEAGALWNFDMIDSARKNVVPELEKVVIGVDPAVTSSDKSDCTGIVAAGLGIDGEYYILADESRKSAPSEWICRVIALYRKWQAEKVVIEVNNGGELFNALFAREAPDVRIKAVRAGKDKYSRAEPVAAFYEKRLIHHVGIFPELESEMCELKPGRAAASPDRLDALVWAINELTALPCGSRFIEA